jgi:hypothetical protein
MPSNGLNVELCLNLPHQLPNGKVTKSSGQVQRFTLLN